MSEGPGGTPPSNVYSVLLVAATIVVLGATIYLAIRSNELFGSWNPFSGA